MAHTTPLIAIVGRPNVGKSTLFNRLIRSRRAIVGDEPGITRDRIYGESHWRGLDLRVVDTGGIIPEEKDFIPSEIFRQARVALEEANAVVMVVDVRSELAASDMELARFLQKTGKPVFLAVNKVDSDKQESLAGEFHRLGIRGVFPVSAEHGRGVDELLDAVVSVLPKETTEDPAGTKEEFSSFAKSPKDGAPRLTTGGKESTSPPSPKKRGKGGATAEELTSEDTLRFGPGQEVSTEAQLPIAKSLQPTAEVKVAIIGHPNVGKSTLLNRLTGTERSIVSAVPGTTRDAVDEVVQRDGMRFRFIDTAGIRRKGKTHLMAEKLSVVMARKHLEAAGIALVVIDATEGVSALDATIAGYAHESGRSVIIVVNKWDLCGQRPCGADIRDRPTVPEKRSRTGMSAPHKQLAPDRAAYEQRLRYALKFLNYAPVLFISAANGKGTEKIFPVLERVAAERRKRITTGEMNRFLKHVDFDRASVPVRQRVKILYMTQAAVAPPTFVLFTDRKVQLHFSYQRFLENQIRRAFGFVGTPIWIKVRARK